MYSFRFRSYTTLACLILASAVVGSCFRDAAPAAETPSSTAAGSAAATESGVQTVTGRAPAASGGYPAIILVEPVGAEGAPAQEVAPAMDQEQQTFIPSILLVRTGQPVNFLNHDDVLHNVRVKNGDTQESAFNVAIPTGEKYTH